VEGAELAIALQHRLRQADAQDLAGLASLRQRREQQRLLLELLDEQGQHGPRRLRLTAEAGSAVEELPPRWCGSAGQVHSDQAQVQAQQSQLASQQAFLTAQQAALPAPFPR